MIETTRPGGFTPGINVVFDDGYCAPSDFCNEILEHIREIIPALRADATYSLEMLCDPGFWRVRMATKHQVAGRVMVRLVSGGWLPLRVIGCRHSYPKRYTPN